jgi:hypothetical protein
MYDALQIRSVCRSCFFQKKGTDLLLKLSEPRMHALTLSAWTTLLMALLVNQSTAPKARTAREANHGRGAWCRGLWRDS